MSKRISVHVTPPVRQWWGYAVIALPILCVVFMLRWLALAWPMLESVRPDHMLADAVRALMVAFWVEGRTWLDGAKAVLSKYSIALLLLWAGWRSISSIESRLDAVIELLQEGGQRQRGANEEEEDGT